MESFEQKKVPNVLVTTLIIVLGSFMALLDTSIINVALPKLMVLFSVDTKQIEWVITSYMLVSGSIIPITTYLGNRFGYRTVYVWSVAGFTVGSFLCGLAWDNTSLVVFRVIQAVGGGMIIPLGAALLFHFTPKGKMGIAMGLYGLSVAMAPSIGPTLGGLIVEEYSWRWLFMINVPVGIASACLNHFFLPDTDRKQMEKFDYMGLFLATFGAFFYLLALSKGASWGWTSYPVVMLLLTATIMIIALVIVELHHPEPMLDVRLFQNSRFTYSILLGSGLYIVMMSAVILIPIYFQQIRGYTAIQTGLLLMPQAIAIGIMMPIAGGLYDRVGARPLICVGLPFIFYSTYKLHTLSLDTPEDIINHYLIIRAVGFGLVYMPIQTAGVDAFPKIRSGAATSMSSLTRNVAGAMGIAIATVLMQNRQNFHHHRMAEDLNLFSSSWGVMQEMSNGILTMIGDKSELSETTVNLMNNQLMGQSAAWAVGDVFLVFSVLVLVLSPMALLFRKEADGKRELAAK